MPILHAFGDRGEPREAHHRLGGRVRRRDVAADPERVDGERLELRDALQVCGGDEADLEVVGGAGHRTPSVARARAKHRA